MKFACDNRGDYGEAVIRSLKRQLVFSENGALMPYRKEFIINLGMTRTWNLPNLLKLYTYTVSNETNATGTFGMLTGHWKYELKVDPKKLQDTAEDAFMHLEFGGDYRKARWHDVAVMILLANVLAQTSAVQSQVSMHLVTMNQIDNRLIPMLNEFADSIW